MATKVRRRIILATPVQCALGVKQTEATFSSLPESSDQAQATQKRLAAAMNHGRSYKAQVMSPQSAVYMTRGRCILHQEQHL